jgi:hypothetical protein
MASMLPDANPCCDQCSGLTVTIVSTVGMLAGHGDPEGVVTATLQGQVYTDSGYGDTLQIHWHSRNSSRLGIVMRLLSIIVFTVVLISNTFGQTTPTTQVKTIADLGGVEDSHDQQPPVCTGDGSRDRERRWWRCVLLRGCECGQHQLGDGVQASGFCG